MKEMQEELMFEDDDDDDALPQPFISMPPKA